MIDGAYNTESFPRNVWKKEYYPMVKL